MQHSVSVRVVEVVEIVWLDSVLKVLGRLFGGVCATSAYENLDWKVECWIAAFPRCRRPAPGLLLKYAGDLLLNYGSNMLPNGSSDLLIHTVHDLTLNDTLNLLLHDVPDLAAHCLPYPLLYRSRHFIPDGIYNLTLYGKLQSLLHDTARLFQYGLPNLSNVRYLGGGSRDRVQPRI